MQFSGEQRKLAVRAMDEAEDRTSRYYCIPPFRWQQLSFDLLTRQDHEWKPLPEQILAQIQRIQRVASHPRHPFDFYRIQLNDPGILTAAHRENLGENLYRFFVYILTHEMVHMVRLSSILEDESDVRLAYESEEMRVQRISRQILSDAEYLAFQPILDKFCIG